LPVRLLVAIRTDARPVDIPFTLSGWNVRRVEVGPLETTALGALIRARLGEQLPRPRLEALWKASGGNPMFALELLRHGGFDRADGVQPTLPLALEGRLRSLEPDARAAVSTAAAALQPSISMVLAAGVERAGLEAARAAGIVRIDGERIWFTHPLLASAAYELPLPDERRALHARLAELSTDPVERGHHVARSVVGCDERAAELLDAAAAEAGALGDHAAAASFLLRAADLSSDREGEASAKRQVAAARELTRAGDVECAAALCRGLVDRLPAGVTRGRARQTLNWCLIGAELSYVDALVVLERAMEDAADDALTCADISIEMAELSLGMCRLEEALAHARRAAELAESVGASMTAVHALAYVGFAESMLGHGVTKELRDAYARWNGSAIWTNSPRMILACACIPATLFEEAQDLFEQEIAWAQERGLEVNELISRAHLAETQLRAGRWAEGLANARLALEHARQATDAQVVTGIAYSIGMLEASLGHHAEARTRATSALVEAEATGDFWFTISHRAVLGQIALTENDPRTAVELLEPAWQLMLERGLGDLSLFPVAQNLGEAYSADSRLDDALHVASTLRGCPVGEEP
jgi:tetratricopeptide (TPR) repeat protein